MLHSGSNPRRHTSTIQGYKSWSYDRKNVSISEVNMLKSSSTLAVSVPMNLSIKLGFVSVNDPSETYFMNVLHSSIVRHSQLKSCRQMYLV